MTAQEYLKKHKIKFGSLKQNIYLAFVVVRQ